MKNKTIEWIATLQDQMTAKFNTIVGGIQGRTKQMGQWMSRNWLSVGGAFAGAFYLGFQALEKLEKIAKKVDRSIAGVGGESANAADMVKRLGDYAEKSKKLVDEILVRAGLVAVGTGNAVATFFATLYTVILIPLAKIEEALNALGITNGQTLQRLRDEGVKHMQKYADEATKAFGAAFAASENLGLGTETLQEKVERLKKELDAIEPGTADYVRKLREWTLANNQLEIATLEARLQVAQMLPQHVIDRMARLNALLKEAGKTSGERFLEQAQQQIRDLDAETKRLVEGALKDLKNAFGGDVPDSDMTQLRAQVELEGELRLEQRKKEIGTEEALLEEWYEKALVMAGENYFLLEDLHRVYTERKVELETQAIQKSMRTAQQLLGQSINVLMGFRTNAFQAEINQIEERKERALAAIDAELERENLTEEQRAALEQKRRNTEAQFERQARDAKQRQFQAEKQAAIIQSIMQTAVAVVEALPNIPLAIAVGILGAAQTAVIAGQPTPKFQRGTPPGGFIVPPGYENDRFPILVSSGERVDVTPRDEAGVRPPVSVTVNINAPGTTEQMVKDALQKGLRETGLTIDKYIVNNRKKITLA